MAYYYLVSSLPRVTLGQKPVMSSRALAAACEGQLSEADLADLKRVISGRPGDVLNAAFRAYVALDTQLRDAVARLRGARMAVDSAPFERPFAGFDMTTERVAADAMAVSDPLSRELVLDRYRFKLLEELEVPAPFGAIAVLAYAQRLLLVERWSALSEERGRAFLRSLLDKCVAGVEL